MPSIDINDLAIIIFAGSPLATTPCSVYKCDADAPGKRAPVDKPPVLRYFPGAEAGNDREGWLVNYNSDDGVNGSADGEFAPYIVGLGGTTRPNSSTEKIIRLVLDEARKRGGRTIQFSGPQLLFPHYAPESPERTDDARNFIETLRKADGVVLASPGYHGGISGLVKNALDYTQDMATDPRVYLDGMAVGCIGTGAGWQGANATLSALRAVTHSLRGWPTPLGIAVNTIEPLFDADGECLNKGLIVQAGLMAQQIVDFARQSSSLVRHASLRSTG